MIKQCENYRHMLNTYSVGVGVRCRLGLGGKIKRCMLGLVSSNLKIIHGHGPNRPTRKRPTF